MAEFDNIEFFRSGYGMLPELGDKDPGMPLCVPRSAGGSILTGKCDCRESRKRQGCAHFERLTRAVDPIRERQGGRSWGEAFAGSLWYRLAGVLSEGDFSCCREIRPARDPGQGTFCFLAPGDRLVARLLDASEASLRFLERLGKAPKSNCFRDRAGLIRNVAAMVSGDDEKRMNEAGDTVESSARPWLRPQAHVLWNRPVPR